MKEEDKRFIDIVLRYVLLALIALNFWVFFYLFSPLTVNPVLWILKRVFEDAATGNNSLFLGNLTIRVVESCVTGSAYFLLTILNLSTPMPILKRIGSLLVSYLIFLIINIARIVLSAIFFVKDFELFNSTHLLFWYILATVTIVLIWIFVITLFNIKQIPFYSDARLLYSISKRSKNQN